MPRPPVYVIPGAHDGFSNNPWIDSNDNHIHLVTDAEQGVSSGTKSIRCNESHHSGSQVATEDPLCYPSSPFNEVQSILRRRGASLDMHETRPSLKRAIGASRKTLDGERPTDIDDGTRAAQAEKEVIVHKVQPGDSLPGVALKYNVSLATLRNANKLWANDTIHLRQVLYIPTQAISSGKAKILNSCSREEPEYSSRTPHPIPEVHIGTIPRTPNRSLSWNKDVDLETSGVQHASAVHTVTGTTPTIKRVPLSELSFFPPSSSSSLSPPKYTSSRTGPPIHSKSHNGGTPPSSFSNLSTRGTSTFGLGNLWNGAREEIISRLSFDSTRGSSDTGEEQQSVELAVVGSHGRVRRKDSIVTDVNSDEEELIPRSNTGAGFAMRSFAEQDSVVLNTPRKPIRTVQLLPSPKMVIPATVN